MEQSNGTIDEPSSKIWIWLFQPFRFIAGGKALGIGLILLAVSALLASLSNSHFDGVLDFHTGRPAPFWVIFAEVMIDWVSLSALLLAGGLLISPSRFRLIDLFGTQALARTPTIMSALVTLIPGVGSATHEFAEGIRKGGLDAVSITPMQMYSIMGLQIFVFLMVVWMVVLMYKAFSISCNVYRTKAVTVFIICLIVAEIISKIGIGYLFQFVK